MRSQAKFWLPRLAFLMAAIAAAYAFFPFLRGALAAGVGLVSALLHLVAFVFLIVALPLGFLWLAMFVYSVFLRPYFRAWHIRRIREARHLREAVERGRAGE